MFLDVLGTIVAFISVIALLSVVVTTLVQAAQAMLRLRARNLQMGIAGLIMKVRKQEPAWGLDWLRGDALQAKRDAAILLNQPATSPLKQVRDPTSFWHYYVGGPRVSWVEPEQLEEALETTTALKPAEGPALVAEFSKAAEHLKKRFQLICRLYTVALGVLVAIIFQASTPEMFSTLSEQSVARQELVARASAMVANAEDELRAGGDQEATIEGLLDKLDAQRENLAGVQFELWPDRSYYRDENGWQWLRMLGVLMTAALLSLGAPFWFEMLRNTINFRDVLAGKGGTSNKPENDD